ncbi:MAG TPA: MXAN_2562 family outer membrane beta-barrel protein [Polyangia bacterium]|nr:MXAN_2562 family outer membrane beta-barrel protein [Polyangia bacterium]
MSRLSASRAAAAGAALTALVALPRAARAQQDFASEANFVEGSDSYTPYRTPQRFAFQLTFGPYRPDVDGEFNGLRDPYAQYFGSGQHLMTRIELDYQFWHRYGTIAGGLGVGYFSVSGNSPTAMSLSPSGDESTLKVVPVSVSAIYSFDYFLETRGIPLVPYGKLGFDWAYWQITDGNGNIADDGHGGHGRGATLGWHAAAGLMLMLDFLDPDAAHDFDQDLGVNHTGIAFEYYHADISGLGESNRLHVGDNNWTLGLVLEF